jgi:hypothetical protein
MYHGGPSPCLDQKRARPPKYPYRAYRFFNFIHYEQHNIKNMECFGQRTCGIYPRHLGFCSGMCVSRLGHRLRNRSNIKSGCAGYAASF